MTVELRPLGIRCNIQCQYCYQNPQRDAAVDAARYDLEKMKAGVERDGGPFTLFGGEPLLLPDQDLEDLWSWGFSKYGSNGIQTNGSLVGDRHIAMFKAHKVQVGVSVDGPGELNDARWAGSLSATRAATRRTQQTIDRLCREGIPPSLIVNLHRGNATADKLPIMHDWFRYLEGIGVTSARLHILEVDDEFVRRKYALSTEENIAAFLSFAELEKSLVSLKFDLFEDMKKMLSGQDRSVTCIWTACDPYTTRAVRGVEGDGQSSNCGRVGKDGVNFVKASSPGYERYQALYLTPQEAGGCKDCRFFLMCKGQCPGTAVGGDWRNRTEHCEVWKALYAHLEAEMLAAGQTPISTQADRERLEKTVLGSWAEGRSGGIADALERLGAPAAAAGAGTVG